MDNFNQQQQTEIDKRINEEVSKRLRSEESLQNQIKWLKVEIQESNTRERVNKLENQFSFYFIATAIVIVVSIFKIITQ